MRGNDLERPFISYGIIVPAVPKAAGLSKLTLIFIMTSPIQTSGSREAAAPTTTNAESAPNYRVLGWDGKKKTIYFQSGTTGQIWNERPSTNMLFFLKLDPSLEYWKTLYPISKDAKSFNRVQALTVIFDQANTVNIFERSQVFGRGVYRDCGRTVWNLGDRLEVDGRICSIFDISSKSTYALRHSLPINPQVEPSTDEEGLKLADLVKRMGWVGACDPLYVLGWAVASNVAAALPCRPGLQLSNASSSGKTFVREHVISPLQAGLGVHTSEATAAAIRQTLDCDTLPICIDESEADRPKQREEHLMLMRQSFDGTATARGTGGGRAISYSCLSAVALFSVCGPTPKSADADRLVVVSRKSIDQQAWNELTEELGGFLTNEMGERVIRRTVTHLPVLLENIQVFIRAIRSMQQDNDLYPHRYPQTQGTLLACAYSLVSTEAVDVETATAWLDLQGWTHDVHSNADHEPARKCLGHLLGFQPNEDGGPSLGEMAFRLCKSDQENSEDETLLGRHGLKVDRERGLFIANNGEGIRMVFRRTPWCDGGHRQFLRNLPLAYGAEKPIHFPGAVTYRCSVIPWAALKLEGASQEAEPNQPLVESTVQLDPQG